LGLVGVDSWCIQVDDLLGLHQTNGSKLVVNAQLNKVEGIAASFITDLVGKEIDSVQTNLPIQIPQLGKEVKQDQCILGILDDLQDCLFKVLNISGDVYLTLDAVIDKLLIDAGVEACFRLI